MRREGERKAGNRERKREGKAIERKGRGGEKSGRQKSTLERKNIPYQRLEEK